MIPYLGCEHAQELLEGFVDGELSVTDQIAVESHLRWCRTCTLRVDDMRLIGASLRQGRPARHAADDAQMLATTSAGTLLRIRAERDASMSVRIRELFVDMRLLWPALGATAAVFICIGVAGAVLQAATVQQPESLAEMIDALSDRGSERNPLRPDGGNTIPRAADDGAQLENIPDAERMFAVPDAERMFALHTVVGRDGRVAHYDLLQEHAGALTATAANQERVEAVLDAAVRQSRFAPAQTPMGRAVAVNMVWLIVVTTAEKEKTDPRAVDAILAAPRVRVRPPAADVVPPVDRRSDTLPALTTA